MTERYPFLPDLVFVLIGAFFVTLAFFHKPAPSTEALPASQTESSASVPSAGSVEVPLSFRTPDQIPADAVTLSIRHDQDETRYGLGEQAGLDAAGLESALRDLADRRPDALIELQFDPQIVSAAEVALVQRLCYRYRLETFIRMRDRS